MFYLKFDETYILFWDAEEVSYNEFFFTLNISFFEKINYFVIHTDFLFVVRLLKLVK